MEQEDIDGGLNDFPLANASHQYFPKPVCMDVHVLQRYYNPSCTSNQQHLQADDNVDTVQTPCSTGSTSMQHLSQPDSDANGLQPFCSKWSTTIKQVFEADGNDDVLKRFCSTGSTSNQQVLEADGNVDALQTPSFTESTSKEHLSKVDGNVDAAKALYSTGSTSKQHFNGVAEALKPFCSKPSTSQQHLTELDDANALEHLCINDTGKSDKGNFNPLKLQQDMPCRGGIGMSIGSEGYCQTNEYLMNEGQNVLSEASFCIGLKICAICHNEIKVEDTGQIKGCDCQTNEYLTNEGQKVLSEASFCIGLETCAICHNEIKVEDTAQIKGCEHSYCITCILRWATYKSDPWCPQCRVPFSFLFVYRALDGTLSDYMVEESVCLLLRAFWFKSMDLQSPEEQVDCQDDYDAYEELHYTPNIRLGNRRWGDSGYVRAGRHEARPVSVRQDFEASCSISSSRQSKGKGSAKELLGRRARWTKKREQDENG